MSISSIMSTSAPARRSGADDPVEFAFHGVAVERSAQRVVAAGGDDRQVGPEGERRHELALANLGGEQVAQAEVHHRRSGAAARSGSAIRSIHDRSRKPGGLADALGDAVAEDHHPPPRRSVEQSGEACRRAGLGVGGGGHVSSSVWEQKARSVVFIPQGRTIVLFSSTECTPRGPRDARPRRARRRRRGRRPPAPGQPHARVDPPGGRRPRLRRGARGPDHRPSGHRARDEQERPVRPLRLQGGAAARDDRRRSPALRRARGQAVAATCRAGASASSADARLARLLPRRGLRRRLLLPHRQGRVRQPRRERRCARS